MLVWWGRKRKVRRIGRVADFCPMCRAMTPFDLSHHVLVTHIYSLPVKRRDLGYFRTCAICSVRMEAFLDRYKLAYERSRPKVAELIRETFPDYAQVHAERLALEEDMRERRLTPAGRAELVREPFVRMSYLAEDAYSNRMFDWPVLASFFATVVLAFVVARVAWEAMSEDFGAAWNAAAAVFAVGLVLTAVQAALTPGRKLRKVVYPRIARTLQPLAPTPEDVVVAMAELEAHGHRIGHPRNVRRMLDVMAAQARESTSQATVARG